MKTIVLAAVLVLLPSVAWAEGDAGACTKTLTRDDALKLRGVAAEMMKVASAEPLEAKQSLDTWRQVPPTVRGAVTSLQCTALLGKELAETQAFGVKASKWADDYDAKLSAEDAGRASTVLPLCEATWGLENAKASMAQERANPGGVVDLRALHKLGEQMQYWQARIDALRPGYVAFRRHGFNGWRTEGVCVAAASVP